MLEIDKINIINSVYQPCSPNWHWYSENGVWNGNLLWLVTGGEAELESPYGKHKVHPGSFIFMPINDDLKYSGRHDPEFPLVVYWIYFQVFDKDGNLRILKHDDGYFLNEKLRDFYFAHKIVKRIVGSSGTEQLIWMKALLKEVYRQKKTPDNRNSELIDRLCSKIKESPRTHTSIEKLAKDFGYCKDHFIRLFKNETGKTPKEYIIDIRIEGAMNLLKMSSSSIQEIADMLGYSDMYAFSKQFKAKTGVSPRNFRQKQYTV